MKPMLMLPVLAGLMLTGCEVPTPSLLSLESAATVQEALDRSLAGVWTSDDSDQDVCIIRAKENGYEVGYISGNSPRGFSARLIRAGDARILELKPDGDDDFSVAGYSYARVWTEGNGLRWAFLDSDWFKEQLAALPKYTNDRHMLLLAPGAAVRAALEKYGTDEKACSKQVTWQRMQ